MNTKRCGLRSRWVSAVLIGCALSVVAGCPFFPLPTPTPTPETPTTMITGTVTNSYTGEGVAGVSVMLDPEVEGVSITTDENGAFSAEVPAGVYTLTFEADKYESTSKLVELDEGQTLDVTAEITPTQRVIVSISVDGDATPGSTLNATVNVEIMDGSTLTGYAWEQTAGLEATLGGTTSQTATVTLPAVGTYKTQLLQILEEPPLSEEDLPPNVPFPVTEEEEGEELFHGAIPDRFQVVGLNHYMLEETGMLGLEVTVETSSGEYTADTEVVADLPWVVSSGLQNVPLGKPVLLHGKTQDTYDWELTPPAGSSATLSDATSQNPYFTPDVAGLYTVTVTDQTVDPAEVVTLNIYAGTWQGAITGQDADGRPLAANCTICHQGTFAPDMFTEWAESGHAEIFTVNLNTSDHYSTSCLECHTVGYDPEADNGGFDDASDYDDFLAAFTPDGVHFESAADNWDTALDEFPNTARLGNIQCENCHGPNSTALHFNEEFDAERISLSSSVCGQCHGEPLRHGRFQQWQLSGHSNYVLAVDEGESGNCSRCHTANGFLAWLPVLLDDDPATDPLDNVEVTWEADEIHPQTCVTCHDPHSVGTVSGSDTDATVRITGDTPPLIAGFTATDVGKGAICMTCHNTRRGLRNDATYGDDIARAPHGSAQTDVLMGQNAYFVTVGTRGSHSLIEDTCVACHMRETPPPDLLSYNQGGTNHTFYAGDDICANCHGEVLSAEMVQNAVQGSLDELQGLVEDAILALIEDLIADGNTIDLNGEAVITNAADVASIEFGESHGRQAITVNFADDTTVGPLRLNDVDVLDGTDTVIGELYDFADDRLPKAGWNWNLVNNDGSRGVHNPSFVLEILSASKEALNALLAE